MLAKKIQRRTVWAEQMAADRAKKIDANLQPLLEELKCNKLKYKVKYFCRDALIGHVEVYLKKPKVRVNVNKHGYSVFSSHTGPMALASQYDTSLEVALESLATLIAYSFIRTPCG